MLLCTCTVWGQVGIGTSTPNAELEIKSPTDQLPALELNPQTAPDGTAMGQIAVINTPDYGPELFMFDTTRTDNSGEGKWLTVGASTFNFGREGGQNNSTLEYAGDITSSGPKMPRKGTIVYTTLNSSGGNATKQIRIAIHNSAGTEQSSTNLNLVGGSLKKTDFNLDFEAGDYIRVHVGNGGGGNVNDPTAVLWIKWRN